jgi:hypothetical protein
LFVKPYSSLAISGIYLLIGIFLLSNYLYANKGLIGIAIITNSTFIGLGQYLEFYFPLASIVTNLMGGILSFVAIVVFYYWKEGQRHIQVRIKNEKVQETTKKENPLKKIKFLFQLLRKQRKLVKEKGYSNSLAFQFIYVEYQEEKSKAEEKNALDFILGKEVTLQRNEYNQTSKQ